MKKLTVFTPTFNRLPFLEKLYESLKKQSCCDFIWFIVDDGSTDGTQENVKKWIDDKALEIQYHYQDNSGKMQAHNYAVLHTETAFFLDIDSDDLARVDCVKRVLEHLLLIERKNDVAGVVTYYLNECENNPSIKNFPEGGVYSLKEIYDNGYSGECTIAFKTDVLRRFLFPKIEGEKFMPESYVYSQIDRLYKLSAYREYVVFGSYLQDGYSRQYLKLIKNNPKSYALYFLKKYELERNNKFYLYYLVYSMFGKDAKSLKKNLSFKMFFLSPLVLILFLKRLMQFKKARL